MRNDILIVELRPIILAKKRCAATCKSMKQFYLISFEIDAIIDKYISAVACIYTFCCMYDTLPIYCATRHAAIDDHILV